MNVGLYVAEIFNNFSMLDLYLCPAFSIHAVLHQDISLTLVFITR